MYLRLLANWVVKITNTEGNSGATGFVVKGKSGEKYIMTNGHVCDLGKKGPLYANYRGERFPIEPYKYYVWNDLCAMKAHRPLGLSVNIANQTILGEETYVIGHPLLEPLSSASGELSGTAYIQVAVSENPAPGECVGPTYTRFSTEGTLYQLFGINELCVRTLEAIASTMSIQPGNSGSPAVNIYGSVVAVAFASNGSGRSYFVPLADLKEFLEQL